jgi:hypothetical protein
MVATMEWTIPRREPVVEPVAMAVLVASGLAVSHEIARSDQTVFTRTSHEAMRLRITNRSPDLK